MQDKMWELQKEMNTKLGDMALDVGIIKNKLNEKGGICDQVRENTVKIEYLDDWRQRKDERSATLTWIFGLVGGGSGVMALLQFVFGVKIL